MKVIYIGLILLLQSSFSWALSIQQEHIRVFQQGTPPFAWTYQYDIAVVDDTVTIWSDILLISNPSLDLTAKISEWQKGIDQIWNNQFDVTNGIDRLSISFEVQIGTNLSTPDYTVDVASFPRPSNMLNWDIFDTGLITAHEYGHMIGLFDEYVGGGQNPADPVVDSTSIMGKGVGLSKARHFQGFVNWLEEQTVQTWRLIEVNPPPMVPIPEPSTLLLLGTGLIGILQWQLRLRSADNLNIKRNH